MNSPDKKSISERDICTKFITLAVEQGGGRGLILHRKAIGVLYGIR